MASDRLLLRWRHSATLRIALVHSAAILLATALLGGLVVHAFHVTVQRQLDQRITDDARSLVHHYRKGGRRGLMQAMAQRADMMPDLLRGVFASDGRRIAGAAVLAVQPPGWGEIVLHPRHVAAIPARVFSARLGDGSTVVIASASDVVGAAAAPITRLFVFQGLAIAMLGIVSALLLSAYLRRRLEAMADTARAIMVGRLEQRMPITGDDEFDRLGTVLNTMLDRIGALIGNLRQVSSDIAHDLRTPLTRLRAEAERAMGAWDGAEGGRARLESVVAQADEVLEIFAALLRISEIEAGAGRRGFGPIDLSALVEEICESYEPALRDGGRRLHWVVARGVAIVGDRQLLAQGLVNLIENAATHTPLGTDVAVTLDRVADRIMLSVQDDGPGIAPADRARVLQRFTRLDASRATPGHGLGLSLVAAVAGIHGMSLTLEDAGPGLRVVLQPRGEGVPHA
ncbi:HAMP domain-containing histidine kinase [Sphingomonas sanguinis]|uniref:histidine kinase n=1 Tax=Sphingomonas sanguinis TaxID=33051 RepID=A0ABU5LT21_9SPHN|nr:HAMP domain-containing sensor histidine kinase [Sphingomonas sanguinis]MDZ7283089.1 HAMP domain-containing histidine kinase [Sphingomonas sanguinis]QXT35924.1 HAMP domain-containing histidine kinase [Sphingomonas sanguinis]